MQALPREERKAVGITAAKTPQDMVSALECTLSTLEIGKGQEPPRDLDRPRELRCHTTTAYRAMRRTQEQPLPKLAPADKPMPTETDTAPPKGYKPWTAGCSMHNIL